MHDRVEEDEVTLEKLPHTRDPEFATPASQEKKGQTWTEKKRSDNTNRSKLNRSSALMKRTAALETEPEKPRTLPGAIPAAHHFMLLLHLRHFLGVFLVHLLQFSHHTFTALVQSLLIMDELHGQDTSLSPQAGQKTEAAQICPCFPTWSMNVSCL